MRGARGGAFVLAVVLAAGAGDAAAKEGKFFSGQIHYIFNEIEGGGRTFGATPGTGFDLVNTLGVDDEDETPEANLWFHFLRRHSINVSYLAGSHEGGNTLSSPLVFEDDVYPAGTTISSDFEFDYTRLHYNFRLLDFKVVDFGLLLGLDLYTLDGVVADTAGLVSTQRSEIEAPFPVVGANLTLKFPGTGLFLYTELSGTNWDLGEVDASTVDFQSRLTWYFGGSPIGASVGYRYLEVDVEVDDEGEADVTHEGFYAGLAIRF